MSHFMKSVQRVNVVFDEYRDASLKDKEEDGDRYAD